VRAGLRSGVALLHALVAVAALGAILTTGFALARGESRSGSRALARVQARAAAESVIADALEGWDPDRTPGQPGAERLLAELTFPGGARGTATLRSLGGPVFAIRGTGVQGQPGGDAIGFAEIEVLVLLDSSANGRIRPRVYPRGWRILP
jgi:hypothetical protein